MLEREKADRQLAEIKKEGWFEQKLTELAKMPAKLRTGGQLVMCKQADGRGADYKTWDEYQSRQVEAFKGISARERRELFAALFEGLADAIEAGWQLHERLPYHEYAERPFRATENSKLEARRLHWVGQLCVALEGYPMNAEWVATWASYLSGGDSHLGLLLAGSIDAGGPAADKVFQILTDSASGRHEIGSMGNHVTTALLTCSNPQAWEFMEKMLLAAQRQEGLRQNILEDIDTAHPQAFRRMLRFILENDLTRFSATVRAVDTWFGFQWDAASAAKANAVIEAALKFLDDPKARDKAIRGDDPEAAYLALWSIAFDNALAVIEPASRLLKHKKPEFRFVAARILVELNLDEARKAVLPALDDADLRIAATAIDAYIHTNEEDLRQTPDLFDRLVRLIERAPAKEQTLAPIVFPWMRIRASKKEVAGVMVEANGDAPPSRLLPYLSSMETHVRARVIDKIAEAKRWDPETRRTLFELVGDASATVREAALKALTKCKITAAEAQGLEKLLARKAGDLRRGLLSVLAGQSDEGALASADRLLAAGDAACREAGLELLRNLHTANRARDASRQRAQAYQSSRKKLTRGEQQHIEMLSADPKPTLSLEDGLGLMDPSKRTPPTTPKRRNSKLNTPAALAVLKSLDELVHAHREESIPIPSYDDDEEEEAEKVEAPGADDSSGEDAEKSKQETVLLGQAQWRFPSPSVDMAIEKDLPRFPMREVWEQWFASRAKSLRDADGLELVRALWIASMNDDDSDTPKWLRQATAQATGQLKQPKLKYGKIVETILQWLVRLHPPTGAADWALDQLETILALLPSDKLADAEERVSYRDNDEDERNHGIDPLWRGYDTYPTFAGTTVSYIAGVAPSEWRAEHDRRYFGLLRWWDEPGRKSGERKIQRDRPGLETVLAAFKAEGANEHDIIDHLIGPQDRYQRFDDLSRLSSRRPPKEAKDVPRAREIAQQCRDRVIEVELARGDTPTPASPAAAELDYAGGLDVLVRVLEALGKTDLVRRGAHDYGSGALNKAKVFSKLIAVTEPGETDTPDRFASAMKQANIAEDRLIQLALYAPAWAPHVEHALGWAGFHEAVWWILAHTRNPEMGYEEEEQSRWKGQVGRYTPLNAEDLMEGAVDVAWFKRAYDALGKARWDRLYVAAKYASSAGGHKRSQLFADAMLGREERADMATRVKSKRQQDAVRAFGLLPLASGDAGRKDLLERYRVLQDFLRTSRQFGSQRQASEKRATAIGMDNLARTAGYPDPIRLQWAMEALETADLAKGPVTAAVGDARVSLAIDDDGMPEITVVKKDKSMASIPPDVRKNAKVKELQARKIELKRSASRMRKALELAMCRGDAFTGAELRELSGNPMLSPMLARLVFVGEGIVGYPVDGGQGLRDHAGKIEPIKKNERLVLAHPHDLLATKKWTEWQRDCFAAERVQPFKQVFRELYVLTASEKKDGTISRRYAGHQIHARQTIALLSSRGWVMAPEEGAYRTFHEHQILAYLTFLESFNTPADIEGLTLEGVRFLRRGDRQPMQLSDVPPPLFSEVMRDVDLVVSVAHRGGVDPEASASTIEMRSQLLRETAQLLELRNVRLKENHALIKGDLGEYSVHLGSGVVHRMPGGALFIVPVHGQHRGRIFLPFADDDPKTAEVVSKVLLLARDKEIKDPALLAQIRHASA